MCFTIIRIELIHDEFLKAQEKYTDPSKKYLGDRIADHANQQLIEDLQNADILVDAVFPPGSMIIEEENFEDYKSVSEVAESFAERNARLQQTFCTTSQIFC